jgi:hypothetical protein
VKYANLQGIQSVLTGRDDHLIRVQDICSQDPLSEDQACSEIPMSLSSKTIQEGENIMNILTKKDFKCQSLAVINKRNAAHDIFCE